MGAQGRCRSYLRRFAEGVPEAEPETEQGATIYLRVPTTLKRRVDQAANAADLSTNAWVMRSIEGCLPGHAKAPAIEEPPFNPVLLKKVNELELPVRSTNCLENAGVVYVGELVQKTVAELLRTEFVGRKSIGEIQKELASMGLRLGMEVPSWPPRNIVETLAKRFEDVNAESAAEKQGA